jgi:hypothetical protein
MFAGLSGTHIGVPSIAQTNRPRHHTPAVAGPAAGPRSRSNNARRGADPTRRRACDNADALGIGNPGEPAASSPAIMRAHTWQ